MEKTALPRNSKESTQKTEHIVLLTPTNQTQTQQPHQEKPKNTEKNSAGHQIWDGQRRRGEYGKDRRYGSTRGRGKDLGKIARHRSARVTKSEEAKMKWERDEKFQDRERKKRVCNWW